MEDVKKLISKVAPTDSAVLIRGETGCGKELVARAVHDSSLRAAQPLVPVRYFVLGENDWRESATWPPSGCCATCTPARSTTGRRSATLLCGEDKYGHWDLDPYPTRDRDPAIWELMHKETKRYVPDEKLAQERQGA